MSFLFIFHFFFTPANNSPRLARRGVRGEVIHAFTIRYNPVIPPGFFVFIFQKRHNCRFYSIFIFHSSLFTIHYSLFTSIILSSCLKISKTLTVAQKMCIFVRHFSTLKIGAQLVSTVTAMGK